MATCALLGQAVGSAAAMCIGENITPDELVEKRIKALQKKLRDDGCWLPFSVREIPKLSKMQASISATRIRRCCSTVMSVPMRIGR